MRPEGWAEPRSEARDLCGVPSERGVVFSGGFPGFAPWAGMRCPYRAWDRERGGAFRHRKHDRGAVSGTWLGVPVSETRSRRRIGNVVGRSGIGNAIEAPYRERGRRSGNGNMIEAPYRERGGAAALVDQEARGAARGRAGGGDGALMPVARTMARLSSTLRPRRACWP